MSDIPEISDNEIQKFIKILPKLIKENDLVKGAIISALSGVLATKEDLTELTETLNRRFESLLREMNQRFEAMERRFEALQREMDKRFNAMQQEMDKRFNAMQQEMDRRFEIVDKRFDDVDKRFEKIENELSYIHKKVDNIAESLGISFEQFGRNVVQRVIKAEGLENIELKSARIPNPPEYRNIFDHDELELDGLSINPPVIAEITTMLTDKEKVERFIKKKTIIEKIFNKKFRGFFIASRTNLKKEELDEIKKILKQNNSELLNL